MRRQVIVALACLAVCGAFYPEWRPWSVLSAQPSELVTDLGTLGGTRSFALGVNTAGHVVGYSETADGSVHAFLYANGPMLDLGTLGGENSHAYRINDAGLIVGRAQDHLGAYHPFVMFPGGPLIDITSLDSRLLTPYGSTHGINRVGQAVGYVHRPGDHMTAHNRVFLFFDFMVEDLGTFGGEDGVAMAINDLGQLVGSFGLDPHADYADRRGFIGSIQGTGTAIPTFGGRISEALDVNNAGRAIGKAQIASGEFRAFSYQAGFLMNLGTLPGGKQSFAYGINNAGDVVGAADSDGMLHGFVYRNGRMTDLNTLISPASGWVLTEARAISETGIVVGTGVFNGQQRAFRLRVDP